MFGPFGSVGRCHDTEMYDCETAVAVGLSTPPGVVGLVVALVTGLSVQPPSADAKIINDFAR